MYQTTYVTKIKETYFKIYTKQVSCSLALPLLNISIETPVTIPQIVYGRYISNFDFINSSLLTRYLHSCKR